jgi:hypothetical protein
MDIWWIAFVVLLSAVGGIGIAQMIEDWLWKR